MARIRKTKKARRAASNARVNTSNHDGKFALLQSWLENPRMMAQRGAKQYVDGLAKRLGFRKTERAALMSGKLELI
jgi:hypothetical protein